MSLLRTRSGNPPKQHTFTGFDPHDSLAHTWTGDKPLYTDGRWWHLCLYCDAILGPMPEITMKRGYVPPNEIKHLFLGTIPDDGEVYYSTIFDEYHEQNESFSHAWDARRFPTVVVEEQQRQHFARFATDYAIRQAKGMFPPDKWAALAEAQTAIDRETNLWDR